ncbi:MAG: phosphatase PAP2 family protein [Acidimicrobiia bacterium]
MCALLVVALYVVFVRTRVGQRIDDAALDGRATLAADDVQDADDLLQTISLSSVALLGGAVVLVGLARGGLPLAGAAVMVLGGANVATQAMKEVLARPDLITGENHLGIGNTLPSGHTTVAMSIAIAALIVAPRRYRGPIALVGVAYAGAVGVAVLTAGWHRPSDTVAAFAMVIAWGAAAAAVLVAAERPVLQPARSSSRYATPLLVLVGVALSAAAFIGLVVVLAARRVGRLDAIDLGQAYAGATVAIVGSALLLTGLLLAALRPVSLDARGASTPAALERLP